MSTSSEIALARLQQIRPGFKQPEQLLTVLENSQTLEGLKANISGWSLDETQVLLPLFAGLWKKEQISADVVVAKFQSELILASLVTALFSGELGGQIYPSMLAFQILMLREEAGILEPEVPEEKLSEIAAFQNAAMEYGLGLVRDYLFEEFPEF